jgi:hypothetical protein
VSEGCTNSEESSKQRELENRESERKKEREERGKTTRETTKQGPCAQTLERDK